MQTRQTIVTTPLGQDVLLFYRMEVSEELGSPFEFQLDLLGEDPDVRFDDILGRTITVALDVGNDRTRYFHGYACTFSQVGQLDRFTLYRAIVRPWIWFLSRTANGRIFQNKAAPAIVKEVFKGHGFSDVTDSLTSDYCEREYCVQYRETDLAFVSRLLEEEGIYYYFTHEEGKHTLVLADGYPSHGHADGAESVPYFPLANSESRRRDHMFSWTLSRSVEPGSVELNDYDFTRPKARLTATRADQREHAHSTYEIYDYPGRYVKTADGDHYATVRMDELSASFERVNVSGNVRALGVGHLFSLENCPREDQNREYLIVSGHSVLQSDEYQPTDESSIEPYSCSFEIIDAKQAFRPRRTTPRVRVDGPQTAVVVGKDGEEIWVDKYGRVKVQFPWERNGTSDENSSCWVRVAQVWAGKTFGGFQIPRIGEEVVVEFLEGDPDRPIITGRVYNGDNMFPYALPAQQTKSGFKSRSTKGGSAENFNELRFEDKKGEEEIYVHAEKDFSRVVENNDALKVGFDKRDPGDQDVQIHNNQSVVIGNAQSKEGSQTVAIWKDQSVTIKTGDSLVEVSMGNQTTSVKMGKSETNAMQSIEFKVGGNSIKVDQSGITIKGIMIKVEGQALVDVKGSITNVKGDGMVVVKGGVVMIN